MPFTLRLYFDPYQLRLSRLDELRSRLVDCAGVAGIVQGDIWMMENDSAIGISHAFDVICEMVREEQLMGSTYGIEGRETGLQEAEEADLHCGCMGSRTLFSTHGGNRDH